MRFRRQSINVPLSFHAFSNMISFGLYPVTVVAFFGHFSSTTFCFLVCYEGRGTGVESEFSCVSSCPLFCRVFCDIGCKSFFFQILQWCALKEEVLGVEGYGKAASNNLTM